ncbi:BlaI/MecI/CopY family transcriptional regulator [Alienimonas chondri]|uniref:BlaI/MecI/CopY family transcriptional regulator n=1 Tax=Alienimonas chondri TaxID=2681879 RepID=A0ABX1VDH3_9PLAN|nr:BlaI/MecI/CopY family transcriptional regulator [Alienimonas chondri]NNJ26154.1 hypothetical protein [Alienimonas chondri]
MTLPDAELAALSALWDDAPRTARQLCETLYGPPTPGGTATVQTLLARLERKGFVLRDRSERAHRFAPAVTREGFAGAELAGLAERLSSGSLTPLLSHLVDAGQLTERDLDDLRGLLAARRAADSSPRHEGANG